jgi:MYXO-CTERM domain-containing protein
MLASLTAPFLALFLSLGGFNWSFGSQTDANGTATVEISADEPVSDVRVLIKGSDGSEVEKKLNLKPGKPTKITWKQKDRQVTYEISIEAGEAYTQGEFEVIKPIAGGSQGAFTLVSDREEIVDKQKIRYKTPFTLSSQEIQVYNTDGDLIHEDTKTDVVEAGETFEMSWRTTDEVFMIKVTGSDDTGYSYTDTRVPWSIEIPHTEVNFDSGKHNIKPDEEWKVSEAFAVLVHELDGIDRANKAVNGDIQVQLYVVGYTDTVGNAADNAKLSNNRAREIAKYFADKGAWCEIHYAGMGERGLAVETGDSVDEVRNRRALYLLGVQKPAGGGHIPGSWTLLTPARPRMLNKLPEPPESYIKYKEAQRQKREAKFGGGGDGGDGDVGSDEGGGIDDGGGSGDGGSGDGGSSDGGSSDGGSSGGGSGGDDGPPNIDGEPGGTKQGCAIDEPRGGVALGLLALLGLVGLRRRRVD